MTRLLLFVTDLELGGTPAVVRALSRHLPDEHWQVEVACLGGFGPVARQIVDDGGRVAAFDLSRRRLRHAVDLLRREVVERRIDVVLSFLLHANAVAAVSSRKLDSVRWWQSIQTTQLRPMWHWPVQRWAHRRAQGVIVPSASVREVAARRCGVAPHRCHVIPNGIDPDLLAPDVRSARLVEEPLRVVFLGRLDPIKRVPLLVEAVRRVENVTLDIFGDGEEANRIGRAASGCSRIRMHGFAPREVALREADLLVLPSRAEGFGLVLIEAMAAGVAVVGADVPGIRDVLEPEQRVDLSGDRVGPLVEALVRHRDDPQFDKRVSGRALERLRAQTWPTIAGRYRARLGDSGAGPVVCPGA